MQVGETVMNTTKSPASDSVFPAFFFVLSTFIGALVWLCIMLGSLTEM